MTYEIRIVVAVLAIAVLAIMAGNYLRSFTGNPVRGVMRVPQGKVRVPVVVCDGNPLKPYKFNQVFEVAVAAGQTTLENIYTGTEQSGVGVLEFKGTPVGFADGTDLYDKALDRLAGKHKRVTAQAVLVGTDNDERPIMQLLLPPAQWFAKALTKAPRRT
ncbi:MAG: hypothetical protein Q4A01_08925 [Coriobacteriales bacterium]|nr:hypothetical protein [Coriobacteriales bacterium]